MVLWLTIRKDYGSDTGLDIIEYNSANLIL